MFEGEIVGEFPPDVSENTLGLAMTGVDPGGRRHDGGCAFHRRPVTGPPPPVPPAGPETRRRFNTQGLVVSIITTALAFLVGGLVVLATGHNPLSTYRAIFNGTGVTWLDPGLRQPLRRGVELPADPADHDAADPVRSRRRVRVPLRDVQHRRPGPVLRRLLRGADLRLVLGRDPRAPRTSSSASSSRSSPARSGAGSPGSSKRRPGPTR